MSTDFGPMPYNIKFEKSFLHGIISNEPEGLDLLEPDDFYRSEHKRIYKTFQKLVSIGAPPDSDTLSDNLKADGMHKEAACVAEIMAALDFDICGSLQHRAKRIRELATLRRAKRICQKYSALCSQAPNDGDSLLNEFQSEVLSLSPDRKSNGSRPIADFLPKTIDQIELAYQNRGRLSGVASGFTNLDYITNGLEPSDLAILAARPGMGKTSLALGMARHSGANGIPCAIYSLEMSEEQLNKRLLAIESGVNLSKFKNGYISQTDWIAVSEASAKLNDYPIYINDQSDIRPMAIRRDARKLKQQHGVGLIIVDYLQLMNSDRRNDRRDLEIAEISRSLKILAKELSVPVIALSQLNRKLEDRTEKRPRLSDLRESGALEQDADIVMFIYRDEVYNRDQNNPNIGKAEIIVGKNRNGPIGAVELGWNGRTTSFYNLES